MIIPDLLWFTPTDEEAPVKDAAYYDSRIALWRGRYIGLLDEQDRSARVSVEGDISFELLRVELYAHLGLSPRIDTYPDCPHITLRHPDFPEHTEGDGDSIPCIARIVDGKYEALMSSKGDNDGRKNWYDCAVHRPRG